MGNCFGGEEDAHNSNVGAKKGGPKGQGAGAYNQGQEQDQDDGGDIYDYCNSKVKSIF